MKRFARSAVSLLFTVAAGIGIFAMPAQATTTGWPQDTTAVQSSYIQSAPDGSIVAANCSEASTAIKVFSPTGTATANSSPLG